MYLCSSGHEEIVHEGRKCPLCSANSEIQDLEQAINELKDEIAELK